jgi:hypothetical protein
MSDLEVDLRSAERDLARDEAVRLHRLVEETKAVLRSGLPAAEKIAVLRDKLGQ